MSVCVRACLCLYLSVCLSVCLSVGVSVHVSVRVSARVPLPAFAPTPPMLLSNKAFRLRCTWLALRVGHKRWHCRHLSAIRADGHGHAGILGCKQNNGRRRGEDTHTHTHRCIQDRYGSEPGLLNVSCERPLPQITNTFLTVCASFLLCFCGATHNVRVVVCHAGVTVLALAIRRGRWS